LHPWTWTMICYDWGTWMPFAAESLVVYSKCSMFCLINRQPQILLTSTSATMYEAPSCCSVPCFKFLLLSEISKHISHKSKTEKQLLAEMYPAFPRCHMYSWIYLNGEIIVWDFKWFFILSSSNSTLCCKKGLRRYSIHFVYLLVISVCVCVYIYIYIYGLSFEFSWWIIGFPCYRGDKLKWVYGEDYKTFYEQKVSDNPWL
jgi:hypothetical protein